MHPSDLIFAMLNTDLVFHRPHEALTRSFDSQAKWATVWPMMPGSR